jgi:RNA polymerase sigma factor (sigma-70 family)
MENRRNVSLYCLAIKGESGRERMSDEELLSDFIEDREEAAFETLVHRHARRVLAVCRRVLGRSGEVDDAFQATFLVLARKAGTIRNRASLAHWLQGVAHRIAVRERVGAVRRRGLESQAAEALVRPREVDMDHRELCHSVHVEIDRLPDRYRQVVLLCYIEGLSTEQAARILDCPHGTVKGRLVRAREILRHRFARKGTTLTAMMLLFLLPSRVSAEEVAPALLVSTVEAGVGIATGRRAALVGVSTRAAAMAARFLRTKGLGRLGYYLLVVATISASSVSLSYSYQHPTRGGLVSVLLDTARKYCH